MVAVFLVTVLLYLIMPWSLIGWHKADIRMILDKTFSQIVNQ